MRLVQRLGREDRPIWAGARPKKAGSCHPESDAAPQRCQQATRMEVTPQSGCVGASPVCPCRCPTGMSSKKSSCTGRCACPQMDGWVTCVHCLSKAEKTPVYNSHLSLEGWLQVWGTQGPALANWPPRHSWGEPHGSSSDTDVPAHVFLLLRQASLRLCDE